jgi:hypothetical protein
VRGQGTAGGGDAERPWTLAVVGIGVAVWVVGLVAFVRALGALLAVVLFVWVIPAVVAAMVVAFELHRTRDRRRHTGERRRR